MTFRELTPETGGAWLLSLTRFDYRGVDSQPVRWPVRATLVLKAIDGDVPDVAVEIESLAYEPGIEGPLVTYPRAVETTAGQHREGCQYQADDVDERRRASSTVRRRAKVSK